MLGKRFLSMGTSLNNLIELREQKIIPSLVHNWIAAADEISHLNWQPLQLRVSTISDCGGLTNLAIQTHCYTGGHEERNFVRATIAEVPEWKKVMALTYPFVSEEKSSLWVEAPLVKSFGLRSLSEGHGPTVGTSAVIYEARCYQLKGCEAVDLFLDRFSKGLPSMLLAVNQEVPSSSLHTVMCAEVGHHGTIIELWRHGFGSAAMERCRKAAHGATDWRSAVSDFSELVASFKSTTHKPLKSSPWK
jgi:hypothetical protein